MSSSGENDRMLTTLLTEMDGVLDTTNSSPVIVLAGINTFFFNTDDYSYYKYISDRRRASSAWKNRCSSRIKDSRKRDETKDNFKDFIRQTYEYISEFYGEDIGQDQGLYSCRSRPPLPRSRDVCAEN